jgi:hypothetical protein
MLPPPPIQQSATITGKMSGKTPYKVHMGDLLPPSPHPFEIPSLPRPDCSSLHRPDQSSHPQEAPASSEQTILNLTRENVRLRFENKSLCDRNAGLQMANERYRQALIALNSRKETYGYVIIPESSAAQPTVQTVPEAPRPKERGSMETGRPARARTATKTVRWDTREPSLRSIDISGKRKSEYNSHGRTGGAEDHGEAAVASADDSGWVSVL